MRYWRILQIEDQNYDLFEEIGRKLRDEVSKHCKQHLNREYLFKDDNVWNQYSSFPLNFESLTEAWFGLKVLAAKETPPDLAFIDIKLVKKSKSDTPKRLTQLKNDLISELDFSNSFRDKKDIETILDQNQFKHGEKNLMIQERAGIYLASLTKKIFPDTQVFVYTESLDAFSASLPFLMADIFTIIYNGKFLCIDHGGPKKEFEWHNILKKLMISNIATGKVSLAKIIEAKNCFQQFIKELGDNIALLENRTKVIKKINDFLDADIGGRWTIGSFFPFSVTDFIPKSKKSCKDGLFKIDEVINSVDLAKSFGNFIKNSHFNAYSHSNLIRFEYGKAHNFTPKKAKKLLSSAAKEMKEDWERLSCYGNSETDYFYNNYILKSIELGNNAGDEFFRACDKYKLSVRLKLGDIKDQIKEAIKIIKNQVALSFAFGVVDQHGNIKDLSSLNITEMKESLAIQGNPMAALPAQNSESINLLGYLLINILNAIYEHGYNKSKNDNKVKFLFSLDELRKEWIIKVLQINGNKFLGLDDQKFLEGAKGDLKISFERARQWISIQIKSNQISRNPHAKHFEPVREEDILGQVEYELRISLVGV